MLVLEAREGCGLRMYMQGGMYILKRSSLVTELIFRTLLQLGRPLSLSVSAIYRLFALDRDRSRYILVPTPDPTPLWGHSTTTAQPQRPRPRSPLGTWRTAGASCPGSGWFAVLLPPWLLLQHGTHVATFAGPISATEMGFDG